MSKFVVDLSEKTGSAGSVPLEDYRPASSSGRAAKIFGIFVGILVLLLAVSGIAGLFYWQRLKTTPQYSLALLIEAARNRDQESIDELVDTDAVVEDFVPQVTKKAVELYGRGLTPGMINRIADVAAPVMPVVKERARAELPGLLRERTKKFEKIPFFLMAAGAHRYLNIKIVGDTARISSKAGGRPLEIAMRKNGDRWKIVGVKDEALATRIARRIGQQIVALMRRRGKDTANRIGRELGLENVGDIIERAGEIFNGNGKKKE